MEQRIQQLAAEQQAAVLALRRYFRKYPELGGEEFRTQGKIMAELTELGLAPRTAAGTGLIVNIQGALPGAIVAIRADMDALPIQDEIAQPYCSVNAGVCHACGHDGHMAILMGLARLFTALQPELTGTVRLLFQPSEEKHPGGAQAMIADGAMDGVDYILGTHLWQPLPVGTIGVAYGPMMASPDEFTITVQGKGGHGSMPHQAVDPIQVGAQLVLALKSIVSSAIEANELAVLSLGAFHAGTVFNIIPDKAILQGTVRSFSQQVRETVFRRIQQTCDGIAAAYEASCTLEIIYGYPPVVNHPEVAALAAEAGQAVLGRQGVTELKPAMVGEDFSYYQQLAPSAFIFTGCGNAGKGLVYPHHHPKFDIDEDALCIGMEVLARTALKLLRP